MKTFLSIIISLLISSASFAQIYSELFAAAEDSSTTYLFYRTNTADASNPYGSSYYIYRYNVATWQESLFRQDWNYSSGGNTHVYEYTNDIEFINDQPDNYFTTEDYWYHSPIDEYAYVYKKETKIVSILGGGLNIESSLKNPQLLYLSSGGRFL